MSEERKTSVFVIDDHPLVRDSLSMLINQQEDMQVCAEAEDMVSAMRILAQAVPDIAIVDLSLKEGSGLDLIKQFKLKAPEMPVVVLSMHDEKLYAERCIRAGARGYVMKRESSKRIVAAIREVRAGRLFLSWQAASLFAERFVGAKQGVVEAPVESLSDRELQVFALIGQGRPTRDIAGSLNVSVKTVQAYCARIKQKLHISSATELLREAVRWHDQQNTG
jgi:DNA-binding NarL/FixJ family response regulator